MRLSSLLLAVVLVVALAGCVGPISPSDAPSDDGNGAGTTDPGSDGESSDDRADDESAGGSGNGSAGDPAEDGRSDDGETAGPVDDSIPDDAEIATATFLADGNATVSLEVAATPAERRVGLMDRESLPEDHGMVFVYEDAGPRSFWMKNTTIPLDIVFVASNGTVLNVERADPEPGVPDAELERYESDGPAQYVIELEQGFANRTGVEAGTEVVFHDDLHDGNEGSDEAALVDRAELAADSPAPVVRR